MKHKNLWFVTDKIDNFELLEQKFAKLKSRMIVEVFSLKKYKEAKKLGFEKVAYNIKSARDVGVVVDNDISMVTMNLNFVKNVDAIMELKKKGIKILGYTAKKFDDVRVMSKPVDMFYYDGEENLSDF